MIKNGSFSVDTLNGQLSLTVPIDKPDSAVSGADLIRAFAGLDLPGLWTEDFGGDLMMLGRGGDDWTGHFIVEAEVAGPLVVAGGAGRSRLIHEKWLYLELTLVFADSPLKTRSGTLAPGLPMGHEPRPYDIVRSLHEAAGKIRAALGIASALAPA